MFPRPRSNGGSTSTHGRPTPTSGLTKTPQIISPCFSPTPRKAGRDNLRWLRQSTGRGSSTMRRRCPTIDARLRRMRSEEHTSELQSHLNLVCRLLLEKKKKKITRTKLVNPNSTVSITEREYKRICL